MFRNSLKLFSIAGFEVKIHASWVIILLLITWSLATGFFPLAYPNVGVGGYWLMGFVSAILLFVSVLAHELMHSVVARRHNVKMKGITLFLFGGVAEMADEPPSPRAEFLIAIAGPLTSILIALLSYGLYLLGIATDMPAMLRGTLFYLAVINGLLAMFNLIPAFPLDGGRVLRAFFWRVKGNLRWATRVAAGIGSGFSFVLMFLGLISIFFGNIVGGLWWILIGIFLNGAAVESRRQVEVRAALEGEAIRRFMRPQPVTVPPSVSVRTFVDDYVYKHHFKMFPVVDDARLCGCVSTEEVKQLPREDWERRTVKDILRPCSSENSVSPDADAVDVLARMGRTGSTRMVVREGDRLVGVVSLRDLLSFLALKLDLGVIQGPGAIDKAA